MIIDLTDLAGADLCAPAIDPPDPGFWPPAVVVARWKAEAAATRRALFGNPPSPADETPRRVPGAGKRKTGKAAGNG